MIQEPQPPPGSEAAAEQIAQVLAAVLDRSPRMVAELASDCVITADELEPVLQALERHGLVALDSDRARVRPGPAALRFARSDLGLTDLIELARPDDHRSRPPQHRARDRAPARLCDDRR